MSRKSRHLGKQNMLQIAEARKLRRERMSVCVDSLREGDCMSEGCHPAQVTQEHVV